MSKEHGKKIRTVRLELDPKNPITTEELSDWIAEAGMVFMCCRNKCDKCQASGLWLKQQMEDHLREVKR